MMISRPSDLTHDELHWIAYGERSHSADTLLTYLTGTDLLDGRVPVAPHDVSSLGTCMKLLEHCPRLAASFKETSLTQPEWGALQKHWSPLQDILEREAPKWRQRMGRAPETYALLCEILRIAAERKTNG